MTDFGHKEHVDEISEIEFFHFFLPYGGMVNLVYMFLTLYVRNPSWAEV